MFFKWCVIFFVSFLQAVFSTGFSLCLALPLASFLYTYDFYGKRLFFVGASLWFILPTTLVAIIVVDCFGLCGFLGIIVAHVLLNMPFATYLLYLSYQKIDMAILWAAKQLGATCWHYYIDIIF